MRRVAFLFGLAALTTLTPSGSAAGDPVPACLACHGASGIRIGNYTSPRLGGQHPDYLVRAIADYRSGARKVAVMHAQVASLTPAEIARSAVRLAGPHPGPPTPGNARPPLEVVQVCGGCHGETGMGVLPETPVLSGQRADYLVHALTAYRSGERSNPTMRVYAVRLSAEQIDRLARYFAAQGALRDIR